VTFARLAKPRRANLERNFAGGNGKWFAMPPAIVQCAASVNSDDGSTFTPGPMVEDTATRLM
jgi:hypothetical protein